MDKVLILVLIVVIVVVLLFFIITYNSLVLLRNRVKDQCSQIDIQLKRRFDLIPNLVETVKAYMEHESGTLEKIVKARSMYSSAETTNAALEADMNLQKGISKLFVIAEDYPELKSSDNFKKMQEDLNDTEDKVSIARQFYSDTVLKYNNKVQMFPTNIVASLFGFKEENYFEASSEERENVKVDFSKKK